MTTDSREILSALIDREPVDANALTDVLETPDARALLVDFVRLRAVVTADDEETAPAWKAPGVSPSISHTGRWRAAAAILLLLGGAGGGFWLGAEAAREEPPIPNRVLEFKLGVDWQPSR